MSSGESLRDIDSRLPNGFHDAFLEAVTVDFTSNTARMDLQLWVGDLDATTEEERETYRKATLSLRDLVYFVIDPPAPDHEWSQTKELRIDGGDAGDESNPRAPKPRGPLPRGAFAYWFFVDDWNSFIHVAARSATLEWI